MSLHIIDKELVKVFKKKYSEIYIIEQLEIVIEQYGIRQVELWENRSNVKRNLLLHELVEREYYDVIRYIVPKYNLRTSFKREKDGVTPFEVAHAKQDWKMCNLLLELGDDKTLTDTYEQYASKKQKDKMMNIVWMDLEFTSLEDPEILECAVIVTDKDLNELESKEWVIHFEKEVLDGLGEWHQNTFKDHSDGGNGLFSDSIASNLTKEQVEEELLDLIKRHCPEKACPLAGCSIHVDRAVLKAKMRSVNDYLHYRVIDVSSFREMMKRWAPATASRFVKEIAACGTETVIHRAMDDIKWSIELMKMFRPLLTAKRPTPHEASSSDNNRHRRTFGNKLPTVISTIDRSILYGDEKYLIKRMLNEQNINVSSLKLNSNDQRLYDQNPHLREVFINGKELLIYHENFTDQNRLLDLTIDESILNNNSASQEVNTTEYWGQRRLLLSEIEFLTDYATEDNYLVVYSGAAPGTHIHFLGTLFPTIEFLLIDTKPFVEFETEQIKIESSPLTEDLARELSKQNKKILFINNTRTFTGHENLNDNINTDIDDQMLLHSIMNPEASLFTFRIQDSPGKILFYEGRLLLDTWSSRTSMECRLVVEKDAQLIEYEFQKYYNAMKYFQNVTRIMYYEHDLDTVQTEGIDHCYDCRAEIFILEKYFKKMRSFSSETETKMRIAELSYDISRNIYDKYRQPVINTIRTLDVIPKK